MRRFASVLNTAAWLINPNKRFDHISDALISLHWLRDPERMEYKIAELTYKVPHGTAPRYLGPLTRVPTQRAHSGPAQVSLVADTSSLRQSHLQLP